MVKEAITRTLNGIFIRQNKMKRRIVKILFVVFVIINIISCRNQKASNELSDFKSEIAEINESLGYNKSIVLRAHKEVWSSGNLEIVDELYSPNFVGHWVSGGDTGLEELKQIVTESRSVFPDLTENIIHTIAEQDLVVTHFISSGTFSGSMNGIPPNGKKVSRTEIAVHRIENGKIAEQWTVADLMTFLNQLGISL